MTPRNTINRVTVRMYGMGTGDCFILKFARDKKEQFTVMIDCGSYSGTAEEIIPYMQDLSEFVENKIDLLIVTHEHQDHVNGFKKAESVFESITIKEAWFAWTENPADPGGKAKELAEKRKKLRNAFARALSEYKLHKEVTEESFRGDLNFNAIKESNKALLKGLTTLAEINLPAVEEADEKSSLPGMSSIVNKLQKNQSEIKYRKPGDIVSFPGAPGIKFYILGPPTEYNSVHKEGKEGTDVYKKCFGLNDSMLSVDSFIEISSKNMKKDLPFASNYILNESSSSRELYNDPTLKWRTIDYDWLTGVGTLALRLNTHLNNTSLAIAIECEASGKVLLFPGDAEYGNWESWHSINGWETKGPSNEPLAQDLLSRTVFYKVGHHLSYNGTALEKGINLMPQTEMVAMVSLDRSRISSQWKSTMPNKFLLEDLIRRCNGKVIMMSEEEVVNPPSKSPNYKSLIKNKNYIENKHYKQYTFSLI